MTSLTKTIGQLIVLLVLVTTSGVLGWKVLAGKHAKQSVVMNMTTMKMPTLTQTPAATDFVSKPSETGPVWSGEVVALRETGVFPRREGIVARTSVEIGDRVVAGQVLATLLPMGVPGEAAARIAESESMLAVKVQEAQSALASSAAKTVELDAMIKNMQVKIDQAEALIPTARSALVIASDKAFSLASTLLPDAMYRGSLTSKRWGYGDTKATLRSAETNRAQIAYDAVLPIRYSASRTEDVSVIRMAEGVQDILVPLRESMEAALAGNSVTIEMIALAKDDVDGARSDLNQALQEFIRMRTDIDVMRRDLATIVSSAKTMATESENAVLERQRMVDVARRSLGTEKVMRGGTAVVAPFTGVITARSASDGQMASPSESLFTMADEHLVVRFKIPESQLRLIRIGDMVRVLPVSGDADPVSVKVKNVSWAIDPTTRTYLVQATVQERPTWFVPHATVRVTKK